MNTKEAYRPVEIEGIVKQGEINLLKLVLPYDNSYLEVVKTEGEYLSALDTTSQLPKGYALVRVVTQAEPVREFGVDLGKIKQEQAIRSATYAPDDISQSNFQEGMVTDVSDKKARVQPPPAAFWQKQENYKQASSQEKSYAKQKVAKAERGDSLGYFKALNLNASDLTSLTADEAKKKIKSHYRQSANVAHPDHGGSTEAMVQVNKAMEVISNPSLRSAYQSQTGPFAPKKAA